MTSKNAQTTCILVETLQCVGHLVEWNYYMKYTSLKLWLKNKTKQKNVSPSRLQSSQDLYGCFKVGKFSCTLQDLLLKTNCQTRHNGFRLRLGLPSSLFPLGLPHKNPTSTGMVEQDRIDPAQDRDVCRSVISYNAFGSIKCEEFLETCQLLRKDSVPCSKLFSFGWLGS